MDDNTDNAPVQTKKSEDGAPGKAKGVKVDEIKDDAIQEDIDSISSKDNVESRGPADSDAGRDGNDQNAASATAHVRISC